MERLYLAVPTKEMEAEAMAYREEYIAYKERRINGSCGLIHYADYDEWLTIVEATGHRETSTLKVPASTFFTIRESDGLIVGTIQLRHELTGDLAKRGGHIGYGIRPSERGKGYGSRQLALILEKARELGIPRVMISCDKTNRASAKVALNNGGRLEWEGFDEEDGEIQIYWIDLTE